MARVSVIIPTFNRCRLLAETLQSVYGQTLREREIIVVDDGSDDDTATLAAASSDRVTYVRIQHAGASAARNAGLEMAGGEYVAFLDSDDLWEPPFLERMTAALDAAPNAGWVYCDYATFDARGIVTPAYLPPHHKRCGSVFAMLLDTNFISTGALVVRRFCLDRVGGFDPGLAVVHDWDLWLRLAHAFDAEYVDEPLVRIRVDSDGLTRNAAQLNADNLLVLAKWRRPTEGDTAQRRILRRNMRASHRSLLRYSWGARRPWQVLRHGVLMVASQFA